MPHTTNAHGLVLGHLKPQTTDPEAIQQDIDSFVHSQPLVGDAVVSLFEDDKNHGHPGDTIAVQVDLKVPPSSPSAHPALEAIQQYMAGLPDFKPGSVEHY